MGFDAARAESKTTPQLDLFRHVATADKSAR